MNIRDIVRSIVREELSSMLDEQPVAVEPTNHVAEPKRARRTMTARIPGKLVTYRLTAFGKSAAGRKLAASLTPRLVSTYNAIAKRDGKLTRNDIAAATRNEMKPTENNIYALQKMTVSGQPKPLIETVR